MTLELRADPDPRYPDFYELRSGRCHVGILRRHVDGFRPPFWTFNISAIHQGTTGIVTHGGGRDREDTFAKAKACWADQIEALGLQPASETCATTTSATPSDTRSGTPF